MEKEIKKITTFLICFLFFGLFCLIISMIIATRRYPSGESGNEIIDYLLSNVTIQTVVTEDEWIEKYPYRYSITEKWGNKVDEFEKSLNNFCTTSFPETDKINKVITEFEEKVLNYHISEISGIYESNSYIKDIAENVIEFKETVNKMEIPFLYVQTPFAGTILYYQGQTPAKGDLAIAERSRCLLSTLEDNGINAINIAKDYAEDITFDGSNHWMPQDGLDCVKVIGNELSKTYGLDINMTAFEKGKFVNLLDKYPNESNAIKRNMGYNYFVPVPDYETNYNLIYAEGQCWSGSFNEVMFHASDEWGLDGGAYHNVFRISNSLVYEIVNYEACNDIEVLIIGDSYTWPVSTYMSLGVKKVSVIHNASFTGSLISYIEQNEPDIVMIVYNDAEFFEIYTEDAYYLK